MRKFKSDSLPGGGVVMKIPIDNLLTRSPSLKDGDQVSGMMADLPVTAEHAQYQVYNLNK